MKPIWPTIAFISCACCQVNIWLWTDRKKPLLLQPCKSKPKKKRKRRKKPEEQGSDKGMLFNIPFLL